ncbi:putative Co/Zn/Cd cation transporter, cation efflux family [Methanophagales archaeon]|nr:putative Co/Zn/Cd cation transporter, cation efflux family [Methanophagales archaeon]
MGIAGLLTWQLSGSEAPKLDGTVCLVSLATGLLASWVGAQALRKPTEEYPYGRFANESIYIMFRALMLLGIVVLALVGSVGTMIAYFVTREGVMVGFKILIVYSVLMVIPCIGMSQIHKKNNRKIGNKSEVLKVEDTAAVLSAILSGAIGVAFAIFGLIPDGTWITSDTFNIKFIADSIVVLILCILTLSTPWIMFKTEIQRIVGKNVAVDVRLAYAGNKPVAELDTLRTELQEGLKELFESVHSYLIFSGLRVHEAGQPADPDAPAPST